MTGIELIIEELENQKTTEGFQDRMKTNNSVAKAAACYAMPSDEREKYQSFTFSEPRRWYPRWWPKAWDVKWWKPTPEDRIKELVVAGALILVEIERLQGQTKSSDIITGVLSVFDDIPQVITDHDVYKLTGCDLSKHTDGSWNFNMSLYGNHTAYKEGEEVSGALVAGKFYVLGTVTREK